MSSSDELAIALPIAVSNRGVPVPTGDAVAGATAANVIPFSHAGTPTEVPPALATELANALRTEHKGVLTVLRLGEYRMLEQVFGRAVARELVARVAERLGTVLRADDLLVPLADDEFALLLVGVGTAEAVVQVAERLLASCRGVYELQHQRVQAHARLGIARFPDDGTDAVELLRGARIALHETEAPHSAPYHFFSPDLCAKLRERVWLATELEGAIAEGRLELHYQPLFAMDSQQTVGAEALLRLRSSTDELIAPNRFIPLAEESGLIVPIGEWVLKEACDQLARWRRAGADASALRMAVNVSPRQLADPGFAATVDAAVEDAGIAYQDLVLEITESVVVDRLPLIEKSFTGLTSKGVQIALDDFGTGFSALAYLARLPLSTVKIDRAFLQSVPEDKQATRLISAVIAMARELGMEVTAEGVESEAQFRFLAAAGCHLGQGFGYARPQVARRFPRVLRDAPPWTL